MVFRGDESGRAGTESGYGRRRWSYGKTNQVVPELNRGMDDVTGSSG